MEHKNVFGLSEIVSAPKVRDTPDLKSIERQFLSGAPATAQAPVETPEQLFKKSLDDISNRLGFNVSSLSAPSEGFSAPSSASASASALSSSSASALATLPSSTSAPPSAMARSAQAAADESDSDDERPAKPPAQSTNERYYTAEQTRRDRAEKVLNNLGIGASQFLEDERQEDLRSAMFEEIDELYSILRDEKEDLSRIKIPERNASNDEISECLRVLRRKNDRKRCCQLAEEFMMFGATSLEDLFNGEREWFGHRPDLRGWPNHVRSKLRRMRHDTSTLVGGLMNDYNIGPGVRIALELLPNLFMYSRDKTRSGGAIGGQPAASTSDAEVSQAINHMRDSS